MTFDTTDQLTQILHPSFKAVLPPSSSLSDLWPDSQHVVALPQGSQMTIASQSQAVLIGFRLLRIILDPTTSPEYRSAILSVTENHLPWALDSCLSFWQNFKGFPVPAEMGKIRDEIHSSYLQILEIVAVPLMTQDEDIPHFPKLALSFSNQLSGLIQSCSKRSWSTFNQVQLASLLTRLRSSIEEHQGNGLIPGGVRRDLRSLIIDTIEPTISSICHNIAEHKSLERDLQVCMKVPISAIIWSLINVARAMLMDVSKQLAN